MARRGLRLTRSQRIRKRADFVRIQDGGTRVSTRHFLLLLSAQLPGRPGAPAVHPATGAGSATGAAPATGKGPARLGVVASRKVGGSVERNRAKRLVREAFRKHQDLFPPNIDVVIIVRQGAHELACADVEAELTGVGPLLQRRAASVLRDGAAPSRAPGRPPGPQPEGRDPGDRR
jgi:ribonuclease P protein component